ncbi:MAG: tetratricopeptide repeat protein [Clostridia bacterium]|nr:tetratricopeptide repeat protein [Clostridia bacterium]
MKKRKAVLILVTVLVLLLDVAIIGLAVREYLQTDTLSQNTVTRAILLLIGSVFTLIKAFGGRRAPKRTIAFYRKHYNDLMGNAFLGNPKGEKEFLKALNAFNADKPLVAIKHLDRLWPEVESTTDRFAVATFLGLCYDDGTYYLQAAEWYEKAAALTPNSTVLSNAGICYQRLGNNARAIEAYERALKVDPQNANAYSNIANLYVREAEYEGALEYAEKALAINANLIPAHSARSIAYAAMGDEEAYEKALCQAAAAGADRKKIELAVRYILDEND